LKSILQTGRINSVDYSKGKYFEKRNKGPKIVADARPASIPSKKVSTNSYAGIAFDTVGPALYNPNMNTVKLKAQIGDFASWKGERKVFDSSMVASSVIMPKDFPGPGNYEHELAKRKNYNAQGKSSMFLSQVPVCKREKSFDVPGPGSYNATLPVFGTSVLGSKMESVNDSVISAKNTNQFVSTTGRGQDIW